MKKLVEVNCLIEDGKFDSVLKLLELIPEMEKKDVGKKYCGTLGEITQIILGIFQFENDKLSDAINLFQFITDQLVESNCLKKEKLVEETLDAIGKDYGKSNLGKGRTIVIDFSAPNIAKPFSVGHLRSTVIGNSLHKLYSNLGYRVIGVNHLGDWGTQFGKLITAYKKWGNEKELAKDPIKYLLGLYVKFHKEAESDKSLEDEARNEFRNLEKDNRDSVDLWKKFRDLSLKEFDKVYSLLNIKFDSYNGEAFYRDMLEDTIKRIRQRTEIENSDGALIVNLKDYGMPPLIIQKSLS